MEITTRELRQMAGAVDERHRQAMRTFREETAALHMDAVSAAATVALTDIDIAVYAQSVELAAVAVYQIAGAALGDLKPVGDLFGSHHKDHADAFASLTGGEATNKPNAALVTAVTPLLEAVKTQTDALNLAFVIENQAAATYAFALTALSVPAAIAGTATILPVEAEHAAILGAALGKSGADLFPNGAFEAASVGVAGNPKTGLDPAKYPAA